MESEGDTDEYRQTWKDVDSEDENEMISSLLKSENGSAKSVSLPPLPSAKANKSKKAFLMSILMLTIVVLFAILAAVDFRSNGALQKSIQSVKPKTSVVTKPTTNVPGSLENGNFENSPEVSNSDMINFMENQNTNKSEIISYEVVVLPDGQSFVEIIGAPAQVLGINNDIPVEVADAQNIVAEPHLTIESAESLPVSHVIVDVDAEVNKIEESVSVTEIVPVTFVNEQNSNPLETIFNEIEEISQHTVLPVFEEETNDVIATKEQENGNDDIEKTQDCREENNLQAPNEEVESPSESKGSEEHDANVLEEYKIFVIDPELGKQARDNEDTVGELQFRPSSDVQILILNQNDDSGNEINIETVLFSKSHEDTVPLIFGSSTINEEGLSSVNESCDEKSPQIISNVSPVTSVEPLSVSTMLWMVFASFVGGVLLIYYLSCRISAKKTVTFHPYHEVVTVGTPTDSSTIHASDRMDYSPFNTPNPTHLSTTATTNRVQFLSPPQYIPVMTSPVSNHDNTTTTTHATHTVTTPFASQHTPQTTNENNQNDFSPLSAASPYDAHSRLHHPVNTSDGPSTPNTTTTTTAASPMTTSLSATINNNNHSGGSSAERRPRNNNRHDHTSPSHSQTSHSSHSSHHSHRVGGDDNEENHFEEDTGREFSQHHYYLRSASKSSTVHHHHDTDRGTGTLTSAAIPMRSLPSDDDSMSDTHSTLSDILHTKEYRRYSLRYAHGNGTAMNREAPARYAAMTSDTAPQRVSRRNTIGKKKQ